LPFPGTGEGGAGGSGQHQLVSSARTFNHPLPVCGPPRTISMASRNWTLDSWLMMLVRLSSFVAIKPWRGTKQVYSQAILVLL